MIFERSLTGITGQNRHNWPGFFCKRRPHKIAKNDPLCPQIVRIGSIPLVRADATINFEKSEVFCAKKCGRPHLKNTPPPLSVNVRTGQISLS